MHRPQVLTALAFAAALAVAGCSSSGSDDASATSTTAAVTTTASDATTTSEAGEPTSETTVAEAPAEGSEELCGVLQKIADYDTEMMELSQADDTTWEDVQGFFSASTDDVLGVYDEAIALDTDLTDDLQVLRDYTADVADLAGEATSMEALGEALLDDPAINAAGNAGMAVDEFAQTTCGFSVSNS